MMDEQTKYYCRRCKLQLGFLPLNERERFCCRGCFRMFYERICIVCEETKSGSGMACTRPACQTELRAIKRHMVGGRYMIANSANSRSKTPIFIGSDPSDRVDPRPYLMTPHGITKPRTMAMYGWDKIPITHPRPAEP